MNSNSYGFWRDVKLEKGFTAFKYFFYSLLGLALVTLLVAYFLPRKFEVKSSIVVDRPNSQVFNFICKLKNQQHFAPWQKKDPDLKIQYSGIDGEVGFRYQWQSTEFTSGEVTITQVEPNKRVQMISYLDEFNTMAYAEFNTTSINPKQTKVEWSTRGEVDYPMNIFLLGYEFQPIYDDGLRRLKLHLENIPQINP